MYSILYSYLFVGLRHSATFAHYEWVVQDLCRCIVSINFECSWIVVMMPTTSLIAFVVPGARYESVERPGVNIRSLSDKSSWFISR